MRKFSLVYYFDLIKMCDDLYKYKYGSRAAVGLVRTLLKVNKNRAQEAEKFTPEHLAYKDSDEFKALAKEMDKRDDDDDYKYDNDPTGDKRYEDLLQEGKTYTSHEKFVETVQNENEERLEL
jgi:hypothetical protein